MLRALALSVTVAAIAMSNSVIAAADPQPLPTTYAIGKCITAEQPAQPEPERFDYNCDSTGVLQDMVWTSWDAKGAKGEGTDDSLECQPNCAQGTRLTNPVVVHAWNPQPAASSSKCPRGFLFYTDMTIAYPDGVPPWIKPDTTWDVGTDFVTVDGMPAVHFSGMKPNCRLF
ncbi:hypothetical protein [Mycolicibacterium sp. YH-1]|uniref:hypothetical protein n=1 Tax=Mycolicibacterium sp. YH-1 TaxID=2908837 RepID=UPI001F4C476E|nr:hypothetical protein [Mycolicibacterium sp. YH-1]UNB51558.1 hypothetical protein L0M16_27190 [Mycolicibacterium sp. YH-1]